MDIEIYLCMFKDCIPKSIKQGLCVSTLVYCKTILQSVFRFILIFALIVFSASCGSNGTPTQIQNITNNGSDKKLPDDDGYTGSGGTGDGGGGQGIYCSQNIKNPALKSQLLVRDIFEAIHNTKLNLKTFINADDDDVVHPESIKLLINSLKQYFGPALPNLEVGKEIFWKDFISKISFIQDNAKLLPSQDANSPIALPPGCKIVQIAYWDDSSGKRENGILYVDRELWRQLDQLNKIALLAHEYFFKEARGAGYKNSDFVRGKIGALLSTQGLAPLFKKWTPATDPLAVDILPANKKGFKFCTGKSYDDPSTILHLYQYEGSDQKQRFVIPRLRTSFAGISSLQGTDIPLANISSTWTEIDRQIEFTTDLFLLATKGNTTPVAIEDGRGRRIKDFNTLRFENTGLLGIGDYLDSVLFEGVSVLHKTKEQIWSTPLETGSSNLNISVLNPVKTKSSKLIAHNISTRPGTLIQNSLIALIRNEINQWNDVRQDQPFDEKNTQKVMIALLTLNNEIKKAMDHNTYPNGFPQWKLALRKLTEELVGKKSPDYQEVLLSKNHITEFLPAMLFRSKMETLNEEDYGYLTADIEEFDPGTDFSISKGRIEIRSKETATVLELTCADYDELYFKRASEDPKPNTEHKNFRVAMTSNKPQVIGTSNIPAEERIKQVLLSLSKNPLNITKEGSCVLREPYFEMLDCDTIKALYQDLRAFDIKVHSCSDRNKRIEASLKENSDGSPQLCLIINPIKTNRYYLIGALFLDKIQDDPALIDFIKGIAPPEGNKSQE